MLFARLAAVSDEVRATRSRRRKTELLAEVLAALPNEEVLPAVGVLSGAVRQGRIGIGFATLRAVDPEAAQTPALTIAEVDHRLSEIAGVSGAGSAARREQLLGELLGACTPHEQRLLRSVLAGDLRQGALEGVLVEAVAAAAEADAGEVRRAFMVSGDLGAVALAALRGGTRELAGFRMSLFRPLLPMLAKTSPSAAEAIESLGEASVEVKLDGARVQVHCDGDLVRVYTRNLREVTGAVPEVVETAAGFSARKLVLDGEVIALDEDGSPRPFQVTMSRFGRTQDVEEMRAAVPLTPVFFDCLHRDGEDLIDRPASERIAALEAAVPESARVIRIGTDDPGEAEAFFERVLAAGHEGIVVKDLDAPYEAGRRGAAWLKVKPAHTLDLVILAAEWGSGRRRGWLSNLHLGAFDPDAGGFVMLGKTFKGLTDEMLEWQTERLLALEDHRSDWVVHVRPELVVEIAFDGVQDSSRYPGGMALRFARVKGYREDKRPEEADTVDAVRAIHRRRYRGDD
jgi:DNA ligase-1